MKDRTSIVARYLTLGYLNASFHATSKPVPNQPHQVDVVYQISEGPRVETATIITDGRQHTQQSLIDQQLKIRTGEPLSENNMLSSESHLYNLGIFDWAEVDPRSTITDQTHEDVVVKVHEAKRNIITYGFGFQVLKRGGAIPSGTVAVPGLPPVGLPGNFVTSEKTFWGPEGTFEYTRLNMRGKAETVTFSSYAGRLDQRASINYTQPSFFGTQVERQHHRLRRAQRPESHLHRSHRQRRLPAQTAAQPEEDHQSFLPLQLSRPPKSATC